MDDVHSKIQMKRVKVENALIDLDNEIRTTISYLLRLRNYSSDIVRSLNSKTLPEIYFREFMSVNSFILKYLDFLTEINCKFEMLIISENRPNVVSDNFSILSSMMSLANSIRPDSQFGGYDSFPNVNFNENKEDYEKANWGESYKSNILYGNDNPSDVEISMKNKTEMPDNVFKFGKVNNKFIVPEVTYTNVQTKSDCLKESKKMSSSPTVEAAPQKSAISHCGNPLKSETFTEGKTMNQQSFDEDAIKNKNSNSFGKIDSKKTDKISSENKSELKKSEKVSPQVEAILSKANENNNSKVNESKLSQGTVEKNLKTPNQKKKQGNKITDEISSINISKKIGHEYIITIEHIQSPSEFYVYIKDSQEKMFADLMSKLKQFCVKSKKSKKGKKNKKVTKSDLSSQSISYVLFYSKCEEIWCRGKVIDWYLNYKDDFIKIFLLDYGESKCVSIEDIEPMPGDFKKFPARTKRCHLYGIFPPEFDNSAKTLSWNEESIEKMKVLTETSSSMKIIIAPEDEYHSSESLPVTLWSLDDCPESVNKLLINSGDAIVGTNCDETLLKTGLNDVLKHWNPMKEDYEAQDNCYDLDINDPASYIYGYVGKDYEKICKHYAKTGYCFKGNACKKEHKKLDPLGFTLDQEEVFRNAFNSLVVPQSKSIVNVQVTCISRINKFCCIFDNYTSMEEETLETLLTAMNKPENVQCMRKLLIPPCVGQLVVAQYSRDDSWYRAKILDSQPETDEYAVLFVDYGNKETLSLSRIRAIEAKYLHLPFQAVYCHIFGIKRNPQKSLKESVDFLDEKIANRGIKIEIVSRLPGEDVNLLVNVFDKNGRNIVTELMANDYAIVKEEVVIDNDSESIPG